MLLVDTNIWLAAGDSRSGDHQATTALLAEHQDQLAAPVPVIAETAWLILDRAGPAAQAGFLRLIPTGRLEPVDLEAGDWQRVLELIETYSDLALDIVDASLIAVAERVDQRRIATLDLHRSEGQHLLRWYEAGVVSMLFVDFAVGPSFGQGGGVVTHWGAESPWVMNGGKSWWNFIKSGMPGRAAYSSGVEASAEVSSFRGRAGLSGGRASWVSGSSDDLDG